MVLINKVDVEVTLGDYGVLTLSYTNFYFLFYFLLLVGSSRE